MGSPFFIPAYYPRARMSASPSQFGQPDRMADPDGADAADLALVRDIRAGNASSHSWTTLLQRYQDRLYAVCLRMIGNPDAAADLTQDAIVKIIQGLGSYDGRSKLSTWMIRVTMNTCLSYLRSQRLRKHISLDAPDGPGNGGSHGYDDGVTQTNTAAAPAPAGVHGRTVPTGRSDRAPQIAGQPREQATELGPDQRVQLEEARRHVAAALNLLQPEQRAILVLRDVQGLDYEQIADVLEVAVGTVKSRLFRARAAMRELIEASQGD